MSDFAISIPGGKSKRLLTGGKYCPDNILVTAEGGVIVAVEEKDVNFYDYDGTCLYAYTLEEARALTELPPLPYHNGLVCQGWNWSLEDVNALDQFMVIGATYITDDGKTRLYISLEYDTQLTVPLHIRQTVSEGVEIDWGDGSAVETISGTDEVSTTHTYAQIGDYVIKLNVISGTLGFGASDSTSVVGTTHTTIVRKAGLGSGVTTLGVNAFYKNYRLETITIPNGLTGAAASGFSECGSLVCIVFPAKFNTSAAYFMYSCSSLVIASFPKTQQYFANSAVRECSSLKYVALYRGVTSSSGVSNYGLSESCALRRFELPDATKQLYSSSFASCRALTELTVPANVATISASALNGCTSLVYLRFLPTTPPTVSNANAFTGIPTGCIVEVPADSLAAYQEATNYASLAAQMVGV